MWRRESAPLGGAGFVRPAGQTRGACLPIRKQDDRARYSRRHRNSGELERAAAAQGAGLPAKPAGPPRKPPCADDRTQPSFGEPKSVGPWSPPPSRLYFSRGLRRRRSADCHRPPRTDSLSGAGTKRPLGERSFIREALAWGQCPAASMKLRCVMGQGNLYSRSPCERRHVTFVASRR
jgi:hypothetical protein